MKRASLIASLDIGANIKRLRESRGLSQEELARDICDRTTITKIENGFSKIPSFIFIVQICDKLDISVDEFLNSSLAHSYSLNKKFIIESLFSNDIEGISTYLSNINFEFLNDNDKHYYNFLIAKIYLDKGDLEKAKEYLLASIDHLESFEMKNIIDFFAYNELIKNGLIINRTTALHKIIINNLLEIDLKAKSNHDELIYLLNDNIYECIKYNNKDDALRLLEKEITLINNHNLYKYLPYYYQRKLDLYKDDMEMETEIKSKLQTITKINKIKK